MRQRDPAGAEAAGHAVKTLRRAKEALGVDSAKMGLAGDWFWSLTPLGR